MRDQSTESDKLVIQLEWMLIPLFCSLTGYTVKAVQRKIEEGKWIEGRHYRRAPDGHVTMNLQAYYRWVSEPGAGTGG
jgi:hypothetical protein